MPVISALQAVVLGILQGLTEFLPISSSAHLLILPWFLDWQPMGITFDVMLHGGTLVAVLYYFREDVKSLGRDIVNFNLKVKSESSPPHLLAALLLGTLPAVAVGGLFHSQIETHFRGPLVVAATLSVFGALLWAADRMGSRRRLLDTLRPIDGLIVGAAQAMALVPGVSRSGVTITAALILGFSRIDSARFSFLLAIPVIFLATAAKSWELATSSDWRLETAMVLTAGVLFSFLSGFLCIKYFLRFLESRSFALFVSYRFALAAVILIAFFFFPSD